MQLETVEALLAQGGLQPHFQPIADLAEGRSAAHEALIRTPAGCPWPHPDALFAAARDEGCLVALEIECVRLALQAWLRHRPPGRLFVNLSAQALVTALGQADLDLLLTRTEDEALGASGVVIELTEHERVRDIAALEAAVQRLRRHQVAIALDDFGDGRSSLRLWSELKPEFVKIDRYFVHQLPQHPEKLQTLRALIQIAQVFGSTLIAEGIETEDELHLVRDLGIRLGQGWLLGRPAPVPVPRALPAALAVIERKDLAVFPERRRTLQRRAAVPQVLREVAPVTPAVSNDELFQRFSVDDASHAIAIIDDQGRPLGLVSRTRFITQYAKPYFRELYGRQSCTVSANLTPRLLDIAADIDTLTGVLTSEDQRYLSEGVIIVEHGRYRGLGAGEDLVRAVTEARIEAARHANPLTLLPGNIPITQHIERLLDAGRDFVACYFDLNQFKPFNDLYGYWRGDEMILLTARTLTGQTDPRRDFVGHVGGDDFVVLFQSDDWEPRCRAILASFNAAAAQLYDEPERQAGGVMAEDRHGNLRFHPLTTLSVGAVRVSANPSLRPEDVANAAARAKRRAKMQGLGLHTDAT
ncbi:EAL domain-containing protein [Ideonella sp. B7]|uniref:EAL domain-containing protein n=1 Tax=Ideonella benzenivorans TaxID=2831643 RepID=UPI001CEC5540|nr:EAL domain-containing protein [Ideonella benzenivorans]MCA6215816.1 EAL domain-containing protein [Ideonella benzenivorans]